MKKPLKVRRKVILNFSINTMMMLCMSAIIGIGFLLKYTLISGQERWGIYGEHVELYFLGMDRHQWGMLHFILGFVLFGLLVMHIFLHRKVVATVYQKIIKQPIIKKIVALCFAIICTLLIIVPFFITPDMESSKKGRAHKVTLVTKAEFE